MDKRAQVAIFVIAAVVIVLGIILFFVFKEKILGVEIPKEMAPVFEYYQGCIETEARVAIELAGTQGGYVTVENYFPGSEYAPFSSELNFLGFPVPYWYYVAGNGVIKEKVPSKSEIETQMEDFIAEGLRNCNTEEFSKRGYEITKGEPEVNVQIKETKVYVDVNADVRVSYAGDSARKTTHSAEIDSKFGKFYSIATEIYAKQKSEAVFEQYAVDVLRLYAPVDGVEIQCAPKIWSTQKVINDIRDGLDANLRTVKFSGDYYKLTDDKRKYFVVDAATDEAVNVIYSKDWATKIEIDGDGVEEEIMTAEPVGTQEGMGVMGFCYVPYHFIYDLSFPVLVQIYNTEEMFQFAVVGIVENNMPRQATLGELPFDEEEEFKLCEFKNQNVEINLYDYNLNAVDGNVSYECFNQRCKLGETKNGKFVGKAPSCVNGYIFVRAEGFAEKKQSFSSNEEMFADVLMEREHEIETEVEVGGKKLDGTAIVSFARDDGKVTSLAAPEMTTIKLSEGNYNVSVYVYGNSSIKIPASSKSECVDVPRAGLLGMFGMTKEKCFMITIPATNVDYALIGGGTTSYYILESELEKGKLKVKVDKFTKPNSIEQMQKNFELLDARRAELEFYD